MSGSRIREIGSLVEREMFGLKAEPDARVDSTTGRRLGSASSAEDRDPRAAAERAASRFRRELGLSEVEADRWSADPTGWSWAVWVPRGRVTSCDPLARDSASASGVAAVRIESLSSAGTSGYVFTSSPGLASAAARVRGYSPKRI